MTPVGYGSIPKERQRTPKSQGTQRTLQEDSGQMIQRSCWDEELKYQLASGKRK